MNTKNEELPDPGAGKRRQIDRTSLAAAIADQDRRDALTPPASLTTTMGAVRLLGDLILDRRTRGWTDPMLVVLLRDLGVDISPETLRVYRGRLKKERDGDIATVPVVVPAPTTQRGHSAQTVAVDRGIDREARSPVPAATPVARPAPSNQDDDQPSFDRSIPFDDRV